MNRGEEARFLEQSGQTLSHVEKALDLAGLDVERVGDGILEIEFDDDSKIVINRHAAAQEIWVAARSGGFHFRRADGDQWVDTRTGEALYAALTRLVREQSGTIVRFG